MDKPVIQLPPKVLDELCDEIRKHLQDVCIEEYDRVKDDYGWESSVSGEYETYNEEYTIKIKYDISIDYTDSLVATETNIEVVKVLMDDIAIKLTNEDTNTIENIYVF